MSAWRWRGATAPRRSAVRVGRGIVRGMPVLLKVLSVVGTAAMIWVGGGIILHGLEVYGPPAIGHVVTSAAEAVAHAFPPLAAILEWAVEAAISGVIGLLVGAVSIPVVGFVFAPAWKSLKRLLHRRQNLRPPLAACEWALRSRIINLRIAGPSVSMSATYLGTIEHGARAS